MYSDRKNIDEVREHLEKREKDREINKDRQREEEIGNHVLRT